MLNPTVAARIKRDSLISGKSPEELIASERLVPDEKVAELKSELLKIPYKKVDIASIDAKLFSVMPEETAKTYESIPLSLENGLLVIGMLHPEDSKAQEAMKFIARQYHYNLGVYLISYSDWQSVLAKYSPYRAEVAKAVQSLNVKEGATDDSVILLEGRGSNEDAPIIKIVADTFKEAVLSKASDVHIEPQRGSLRVRFRINGDLHVSGDVYDRKGSLSDLRTTYNSHTHTVESNEITSLPTPLD